MSPRVIAVLTIAAAAACSSSRGFATDPPVDPPAFTDPDAAPPTAPTCQGLSCSRDLKKVLRGCAGAETVVTECGPDQGCGGGACVDACKSAELSKGSAGCSFWTLPPDDVAQGRGACFVAMVANTWDRAVSITAGLGSDPLDISKAVYTAEIKGKAITYTRLVGPLPPGKVGLVFLAGSDPPVDPTAMVCPLGVTPALDQDPIRHGTAVTRAFHVQTDAPVSAYSIFPYGGRSRVLSDGDAALADVVVGEELRRDQSCEHRRRFGGPVRPTHAADRRERGRHPGADATGRRSRRHLRCCERSRRHDDHVEPRARPGASGQPARQPLGHADRDQQTRGRLRRLALHEHPGGVRLLRSHPAADRAVLAVGQRVCARAVPAADHQIISTAGDAREDVPYSLVGAVDGTVLQYDPAKPRGAPETLAAGQIATFITDQAVVVRSQDAGHPFHASVYMTGSSSLMGASRQGDPDFVVIAPSEQFLDRYVFFTDYTFPETSLTLVRRKTAKGFLPVELECAGEVTGWKPLGTGGLYELAW